MNLKELNKESKSLETFLKRITISKNGCWEVSGFRDKDGYTFVKPKFKKPSIRSHRYSYEMYKGKIPEGLVIDHLCKNRCCANPDHLEPVTQAENNRRSNGFNLGKWTKERSIEEKKAFADKKTKENKLKALNRTHCRRGHEYTLENTYIPPGKSRRCKICFNNSPSMLARKNKKEGVN